MSILRLVAPIAAALLLATAASTKPASRPKADLADTAKGEYQGDVISDARGSSHSDVEIVVAKTGPNTISVTSDYPRIPARTFKLSRAMQTIQNVGGTEVFLLDLAKSPHKLDLTIDDASWSGERSATVIR